MSVPFEEPKLGKRQKRPDDFVDDTARRIVPDAVITNHSIAIQGVHPADVG